MKYKVIGVHAAVLSVSHKFMSDIFLGIPRYHKVHFLRCYPGNRNLP